MWTPSVDGMEMAIQLETEAENQPQNDQMAFMISVLGFISFYCLFCSFAIKFIGSQQNVKLNKNLLRAKEK